MYPWKVGEGSSAPSMYHWNELTQKLENKQKVIAYDELSPSIDTKLTKDSISVYSKEALLAAAEATATKVVKIYVQPPKPDWNSAVAISFPYTATAPGFITASSHGGNYRNLSATINGKALLSYAINAFYTGFMYIPVDTGDVVNYTYPNAAYFVPWK